MESNQNEVNSIVDSCVKGDWGSYAIFYRHAIGNSFRYAQNVLGDVNSALLKKGVLTLIDKGYVIEKGGVPHRIFGSILGRTIRFSKEDDAKGLIRALDLKDSRAITMIYR